MSLDIEDVKTVVRRRLLCLSNVLETEEAKNLEDICRERIEAVRVQGGRATGEESTMWMH